MRVLISVLARTALLFCLLSTTTTYCHARSLRGNSTASEERSSSGTVTITINRPGSLPEAPEDPSTISGAEAEPEASTSTSISIDIQRPVVKSLIRPVNEEANAPLASMGGDGKLQYGYYRNRGTGANGETYESNNLIPDYSYAGYMGGGVALPAYASIPVQRTVTPSGVDDTAAIAQAIQEVGDLPPDERGIRGAVLLKRGRYTTTDAIRIRKSGVVLRGEGQGEDGTVIFSASTASRSPIIRALGSGGWGNHPLRDNATAPTIRVTDELLPTGSRTLTVTGVEYFDVGDTVAILKTPNNAWIDALGTAGLGWVPEEYVNHYEVTIESIDAENKQLTIDVPLVETIEARFGGAEVYRIDTSSYRIRQVGVENLRVTNFPHDGSRPESSDYNRAYHGVTFWQAEDVWVRDVTTRGVSHGISTNKGVKHATVQDCAYRDPNFQTVGGNQYSFVMQDGQGILYQRCWARHGRHPLVTGARVPGPNVFLDSVTVNDRSDNGPHHRWATGTLYDNTMGHQLYVRNRGTSGTGHGWTGGSQMFWNVDYDVIIAETPNTAMNYAVGARGTFKTRPRGRSGDSEGIMEKISDAMYDIAESIESAVPMLKGVLARQGIPSGLIESEGKAVQPRSLYLQQLRDRLGNSAVDAITVPEQHGSIVNILKNWDGNGRSPVSAANWEDEPIPS